MTAQLTAKETALMTAIADRFFSFFDEGLVHGSGIWTNTMTEEITGHATYAVSTSQRGTASVINSLHRKGLIFQSTNEDGAWIELTEAGQAWIEAHNAVDNDTTAAVLAEAREGREEAPATEEAPEAAAATTEAPAAAPAAAPRRRRNHAEWTAENLPAIGQALTYKDNETYTFVALSKDQLCYRVKNSAGKASYKRITSFL